MLADLRCKVCDTGFSVDLRRNQEPPEACGRPYCHAVAHWGQDEWDGRARMADARVACDLELNEWDREAIKRRSKPDGDV